MHHTHTCIHTCLTIPSLASASDYYSKGENELALLGWGPLGGDPNGGKNLLFGR